MQSTGKLELTTNILPNLDTSYLQNTSDGTDRGKSRLLDVSLYASETDGILIRFDLFENALTVDYVHLQLESFHELWIRSGMSDIRRDQIKRRYVKFQHTELVQITYKGPRSYDSSDIESIFLRSSIIYRLPETPQAAILWMVCYLNFISGFSNKSLSVDKKNCHFSEYLSLENFMTGTQTIPIASHDNHPNRVTCSEVEDLLICGIINLKTQLKESRYLKSIDAIEKIFQSCTGKMCKQDYLRLPLELNRIFQSLYPELFELNISTNDILKPIVHDFVLHHEEYYLPYLVECIHKTKNIDVSQFVSDLEKEIKATVTENVPATHPLTLPDLQTHPTNILPELKRVMNYDEISAQIRNKQSKKNTCIITLRCSEEHGILIEFNTYSPSSMIEYLLPYDLGGNTDLKLSALKTFSSDDKKFKRTRVTQELVKNPLRIQLTNTPNCFYVKSSITYQLPDSYHGSLCWLGYFENFIQQNLSWFSSLSFIDSTLAPVVSQRYTAENDFSKSMLIDLTRSLMQAIIALKDRTAHHSKAIYAIEKIFLDPEKWNSFYHYSQRFCIFFPEFFKEKSFPLALLKKSTTYLVACNDAHNLSLFSECIVKQQRLNLFEPAIGKVDFYNHPYNDRSWEIPFLYAAQFQLKNGKLEIIKPKTYTEYSESMPYLFEILKLEVEKIRIEEATLVFSEKSTNELEHLKLYYTKEYIKQFIIDEYLEKAFLEIMFCAANLPTEVLVIIFHLIADAPLEKAAEILAHAASKQELKQDDDWVLTKNTFIYSANNQLKQMINVCVKLENPLYDGTTTFYFKLHISPDNLLSSGDLQNKISDLLSSFDINGKQLCFHLGTQTVKKSFSEKFMLDCSSALSENFLKISVEKAPESTATAVFSSLSTLSQQTFFPRPPSHYFIEYLIQKIGYNTVTWNQFSNNDQEQFYVSFRRDSEIREYIIAELVKIGQDTKLNLMQKQQTSLQVFNVNQQKLNQMDKDHVILLREQIRKLASSDSIIKKNPELANGPLKYLCACFDKKSGQLTSCSSKKSETFQSILNTLNAIIKPPLFSFGSKSTTWGTKQN